MLDGLRKSGWVGPLIAFAALWGAAMAFLVVRGATDVAIAGGFITAGGLLFIALTFWIVPEGHAPPRMTRANAVVATGVAAILIVMTAIDGLAFHKVIPASVPGWASLRHALSEGGLQWFGNANFIANPVIYFVLPFAALLLAGVRPGEMGLRWGRNTLPVLVVWGLPIVAAIGMQVAQGYRSAEAVQAILISNGIQNGFFEEFLFRGVLQFALASLIAGPRATVIAAVVFGLWHVGYAATSVGGDLALAVASSIAIQGSLGVMLGLIAERTGSLVAPSIAHILFNSAG
jgi:membrane protease YdiL (CAAX protease family)